MLRLFGSYKLLEILIIISGLSLWSFHWWMGQYLISLLYLSISTLGFFLIELHKEKQSLNEYIVLLNTIYINATKPGDLADRLVITEIKLEKIGQSDNLIKERNSLQAALINGVVKYQLQNRDPWNQAVQLDKLEELKEDLRRINRTQWEWEDKVRASAADLPSAGYASLKARECNTYRIKLKNEINRLFSIETEEKKYL